LSNLNYDLIKFKTRDGERLPYTHPANHWHVSCDLFYKLYPDYYIGIQCTTNPLKGIHEKITPSNIYGSETAQYMSNHIYVYESKFFLKNSYEPLKSKKFISNYRGYIDKQFFRVVKSYTNNKM
jgi:hypothetical protein